MLELGYLDLVASVAGGARAGAQLAAGLPGLRALLVLHTHRLPGAGPGRRPDGPAGGTGRTGRSARSSPTSTSTRHVARVTDPHAAYRALRAPARIRRPWRGTSPSCCSPSSTTASSWSRRRTSSPVTSRREEMLVEGDAAQPLHAKTIDVQLLRAVLLRASRPVGAGQPARPAIRLDGEDMAVVYRRDRRSRPRWPRPAPCAGSSVSTSGRARQRVGRVPRQPEPATKDGRQAQRLSVAPASSAATTTPGC